MASGRFVAYLRVSTDRQGRSGLGVAAQRKAVEDYLDGGRWKLVAEYVEVESGKRKDRPKLKLALAHAKRVGATVVVAKLDRLARDVRLLLDVADSGVPVVFCDLPQIPAGPTGRFILTNIAAVAELEAGLISQRTKAALAAAKARGVKLGNPNGAAHLRGRGNREAVAAVREKANDHAEGLRQDVSDILASGVSTVRDIAAALNARGAVTARGSAWGPSSVQRLLERLALNPAGKRAA